MLKIGLLFPGQGHHYANMGRYLMNSHFKTMFDSCGSEIPGLFEAMSQETINTQFAQMLQFATSIATLNRMFQLDLPPLIKKDQSTAFIFAGHSLGDITALVAANFLTQEQGVAIVVSYCAVNHTS